MDERDFYIFGLPVDTKFGEVRFLTYPEYILNIASINIISQNVLHFYYLFSKDLKPNDKQAVEEVESLKGRTLIEIVLGIESILQAYIDIFKLVLDVNDYSKNNEEFIEVVKDIFSSEENFDYMRKIIMDMNLIKEDEVSPNPEIQQFIDNDKKFQAAKNKDAPSFMAIVTSIVASGAATFKDVKEMTPLQVNSVFARIGSIINYQTTTLFATVSSDVTIESWAKKIDMFEVKNSSTISKSEFDSKFGKIIGN